MPDQDAMQWIAITFAWIAIIWLAFFPPDKE